MPDGAARAAQSAEDSDRDRLAQWLGRARRVAGLVRRSPRSLPRMVKGAYLLSQVERSWPQRRPPQQPHGLPGRLIVSLTSFPPRYMTLAATLKCLLSQTVAADEIILWVAHDDASSLPNEVRALQRHGLTIATTTDLRSFKKIIPTLRERPDAFIAIADDDVFYARTWLEELVRGYDPSRRAVLCHRAHLIRMQADGAPAPYRSWAYDVDTHAPSHLLFPTGVGGVLYPPGSLHNDVADVAMFRRLCPQADDIWLYWMARRAGSAIQRVGPRRDMITWPQSQSFSLQKTNASPGGANDAQIRSMLLHYGFPT